MLRVFGFGFILSFIVLYKVYYKDTQVLQGKSVNISDSYSKKILSFVLITDLSRADVQTLLMDRLVKDDGTFVLGYGYTYVHALQRVLIPTFAYKFITGHSKGVSEKTRLSANLVLGKQKGEQGYTTSYVHGLLGESFLNFGLYFAWMCFVPFAILYKRTVNFFSSLPHQDARVSLTSVGALFVINAFVGDFDNLIFFSFRNGLIPFLLIWLSTKRVKV